MVALSSKLQASITLGVVWCIALILPLLSGAQVIPEYRPLPSGYTGSVEEAIRDIGGKTANLFGTVILAVSVIMILLAAFNFLTAGGDAEKVVGARNTLIYALVGVAIATLAFVLPGLVTNLISG